MDQREHEAADQPDTEADAQSLVTPILRVTTGVLDGRRQWNRRLWASTRAPTQALLGTQAARALLSGPEGSPAVVASGEVGGRVSSCTPGHFDHAEDPSGRSTLARRSRGPGGGSTRSSSRSCRCCRTRCCCSSSCTRSRGWARQSASVSPWERGLGKMLQRRESGLDPCLAVRRTKV